jgi:hypothetical protein
LGEKKCTKKKIFSHGDSTGNRFRSRCRSWRVKVFYHPTTLPQNTNPIGITQFENWGGSNTPPNAKKRFSTARRTGSWRFPQNPRETSRDMVLPYRKPETGSGCDFRFGRCDVTNMALLRFSDARISISFDPIRFRFGGNGRGSPLLPSPKIATP